MSKIDYFVGLLFFLPVLGAAACVAALVVARRCPGLDGAARVAALALVFLGTLVVVHLLPGVLGVLDRATVLAASALLLAVVWRYVPQSRTPLAPGSPPGPSGPVAPVLAAVALGVLATYVLGYLFEYASTAPQQVDMTSFHLPNVADWIQSRTLWHVNEFSADQAFGYYPNNGDLMLLATLLPWHNDFLVRLVNVPLLATAGLGAYALGRELGGARATAALFAVCVLVPPATTQNAVEGLTDTFMLATFGPGVLFLVRHSRTGARADLLLAGLGLGLALGTKWYAFPAVGAVLGVWAAAYVLARRPLRALVQQALPLVGLLAAGCAVWLIRNAVASGNPFFPAKAKLLGVTLLHAPLNRNLDTYGRSIASYGLDAHIWRHYILKGWYYSLTLAALVLVVGLVAGAAVALIRLRSPGGRAERAGVVLALAASAALIALIYLFLPYTAQGLPGKPFNVVAATRYVVPALVIAAGVCTWVAPRLGRLRPVFELAALGAVVHAVLKLPPLPATRLLLAGGGVAAVVAGGFFARRWAPPPGRRLPLVAGALVVLFVLGGIGLETRYNRSRYRGVHPVVEYVQDHAQSGHRIALAGVGFEPVMYPMFGDRLGNRVAYLGRFEDGMLRPALRRATFARLLRAGRYDYVVVQRHGVITREGLAQRQEGWLRDMRYTVVAGNGTARLYRRPEPRAQRT